jgi:hypothetical protein
MCADIKNFALPKAPKNPPQSDHENLIAQSPKVDIVQRNDGIRSYSYTEKYSLALFGALTLIAFGLLIR